MDADKKSDKVIVPKRQTNNGALASAEFEEGRTLPKGNTGQTTAVRTQSRVAASSGLVGVREVAQHNKEARFTALLHHITIELLHRSYLALKRNSAAGIDGVTWYAYGESLDEKLTLLHERIHRGSYRARPARRIMIPKADGNERPLSILCLEDKIVQQAVVYILETIYENDFVGFSYGFRPERSQHDALDALSTAIYKKRVNWVLDCDICRFFDAMNHEWLLKFLQHRIGDKRLLRLISKWLKVGVMDSHHIVRNNVGAPQGAVISPILANVYLHYAFDLWANKWRLKKATGDMTIIRYADDTVLGFEYEHEAQTFMQHLQSRLQSFGLELHPDKTRLIQFGRYASINRKRQGLSKAETFDFLGFTHFCTSSRKNGAYVIGRKTIKKRMRATLQLIKEKLRQRMHDPIAKTGEWILKVLRGHLNYFSVSGNFRSIWAFFKQVKWYWLRALRRRSQRGFINWNQFVQRMDRYFPKIRLLHPHPCARFNARTRGRSPVR